MAVVDSEFPSSAVLPSATELFSMNNILNGQSCITPMTSGDLTSIPGNGGLSLGYPGRQSNQVTYSGHGIHSTARGTCYQAASSFCRMLPTTSLNPSGFPNSHPELSGYTKSTDLTGYNPVGVRPFLDSDYCDRLSNSNRQADRTDSAAGRVVNCNAVSFGGHTTTINDHSPCGDCGSGSGSWKDDVDTSK